MAGSPPEESRGNFPPLPEFLPPPDIPQSGWERVRELYQRNERGDLPEEAEFMIKSSVTAGLVGVVYGGVPAARYSRDQYVKNHQAEIYQHQVEAARASQNAALRGFIRYGMRWGWRVAAFVTIFNGVSSGLSAYRDKVVMSHFVAAGAVSGGLFRISLGLKGLIGGSVIGALLGLPVGILVSGFQSLVGENLREKKRRERRKMYEEKIQEWGARFQFTDSVLQEMEEADRKSAASEMEKITELLQRPQSSDWKPEE